MLNKMTTVKVTKLLTGIPNLYKIPIRHAYLRKPLEGGDARYSVPFGKSIGNPNKMTRLFCLVIGFGFWLPQIAVIYIMHR